MYSRHTEMQVSGSCLAYRVVENVYQPGHESFPAAVSKRQKPSKNHLIPIHLCVNIQNEYHRRYALRTPRADYRTEKED